MAEIALWIHTCGGSAVMIYAQARGNAPRITPTTIMSESYAALTLLSETPNDFAREILSKVADREWDLATALSETALACLDAPGHEGWTAAGDALAACANLAWAS